MVRRVAWLVLVSLVTWILLVFLGSHTSFLYSIRGMTGVVPPVGTLLDPYHGLWFTARAAKHADGLVEIAALKEEVTIVRDDRGVPHVFAASDRDAVIATGFLLAQDRLFQLDFIPRAASGRLSEVFGPGLLKTDQYLRSTGMEWAARMNMDSIRTENLVENDLLNWFSEGVNAYTDGLEEYELPLEFRLLGYRPDRYEPMNSLRVTQFMSYDLSFSTDDASYGELRRLMNATEYEELYPRQSYLYVPIVSDQDLDPPAIPTPATAPVPDLRSPDDRFPGFIAGKGSNNWAVTGDRSATGRALLAGDMHLELTLPSIWYEIHISTPKMNSHGVLIPGSPLQVEAFNERHGWTFTNSGADQIDHYKIEVDSSGEAYRFNEKWIPFDIAIDSIAVRGASPVPDTVRFTRFGPVMGWPTDPIAVQWTAHKRNRTLEALWRMHHAVGPDEFQNALRLWDSPMQNILYADTAGNIAIRTSGHLPIRRGGHGAGLLDGTRGEFDWSGRVPFDELPFEANPESGYLASANQQPAGPWYPHYLGHNWYRAYRSIRINDLLSAKSAHGLSDMKAYQSDVHVVQRDLFVPLLDTISGLTEDARTIRRVLLEWDGNADLEQSASLVFDEYLSILERLAWDEFYAEDVRRPRQSQLYRLLTEEPSSKWLDIRKTDLMRETASDIVKLAVEATADTMRAKYGWDQSSWRWDKHHSLVIRHLTKAKALSALNIGPLSYPGFANTLSPAARRVSTHSASWRMIVDFSQSPPKAFGVYPGGQSGNPFSHHYSDQVSMFAHFGYYRLTRPSSIGDIPDRQISSTLQLQPINPPSADRISDE
jgi:penicillin amidase